MDGKTRTIRLNLKKFVYLISPDKIKSSFFSDLDKVLSSNKVKFFQLRLKNVSQRRVIQIGLKCKKITSKYTELALSLPDKYVSKEDFRMFSERMNDRFDRIEEKLDQIKSK